MRLNRLELKRYIAAYKDVRKMITPYLLSEGLEFRTMLRVTWCSADVADELVPTIVDRVYYTRFSNIQGEIWTGSEVHFSESDWAHDNRRLPVWLKVHGYAIFTK
jgi:hypothetical protein